MPIPTACLRCATVGPVHVLGLLWLCASCLPAAPVPPCETEHAWRGYDGTGTWLCWVCGVVLTSHETPPLDASAYSSLSRKGPAMLRQLLVVFLLLSAWPVAAATLQVGPTRALTTPAAAAAVVQDSDIVEFDHAVYTLGAVWTKNNLTLRGIGMPVMMGGAVYGKAIWLLIGNNTTIENIQFSSATVSDGNGAGVKLEGKGLTVRNSIFSDNQNGLFTGGPAGMGRGSTILVEHSEFARNGAGDPGRNHNMYIGDVDHFTLQYSWSHGAQVGHLVKSRALQNTILYNRLVDDSGGTASYELDLPCGGINTVIGNVIRQDALTDNSAVINHGAESHMAQNCEARPQALIFTHNTVINERYAAAFLLVRGSPAPLVVANNLFVGPGEFHPPLDTSNLHTTTPQLLDISAQRYQLTATSPAIDTAVPLDSALTPQWEYVHPRGKQSRAIHGAARDVGAYEYGTPLADVFPAPPPPPPVPVPPRVVTSLPLPIEPGWYEVANTKLRQVDPCPSRNCAYSGVSGQVDVVAAWNSGALDTKRNRLILWGGGHNGYYGNELYALNLSTLTVERLTEPGLPLALCTPATAHGTQPASRHTYGGMTYVAHTDQLFVYGGAIACGEGGMSQDLWLFDFATKMWQLKEPTGTTPPLRGEPGLMAEYDPHTQLVLLHDRHCLYTYNVGTNVMTQLPGSCEGGQYQGVGYINSLVLDTKRHHLYIRHQGDTLRYDVTPGLASYAPTLLETGGGGLSSAYYPGIAYDPVGDRLVAWHGGDVVYLLDVARGSLVWTAQMVPGGPGPVQSSGVFKRWQYVAALGVFVLVQHVDQHAYLLRLSSAQEGQPSPPVVIVPPVIPPVVVLPPAVVPPLLPVITAPRDQAILPAGTTTATVTWHAVPGARSYFVRAQDMTSSTPADPRNTTSMPTVFLLVDGWTETQITFQVVSGHTYHFWVHSVTAQGTSAASSRTFSVAGTAPPIEPPVPLPGGAVSGLFVQRKWTDGTWRTCISHGGQAKAALTWLHSLPLPGLIIAKTGSPSASRALLPGQTITRAWDAGTTVSCFATGKSASQVLVLPAVPK